MWAAVLKRFGDFSEKRSGLLENLALSIPHFRLRKNFELRSDLIAPSVWRDKLGSNVFSTGLNLRFLKDAHVCVLTAENPSLEYVQYCKWRGAIEVATICGERCSRVEWKERRTGSSSWSSTRASQFLNMQHNTCKFKRAHLELTSPMILSRSSKQPRGNGWWKLWVDGVDSQEKKIVID